MHLRHLGAPFQLFSYSVINLVVQQCTVAWLRGCDWRTPCSRCCALHVVTDTPFSRVEWFSVNFNIFILNFINCYCKLYACLYAQYLKTYANHKESGVQKYSKKTEPIFVCLKINFRLAQKFPSASKRFPSRSISLLFPPFLPLPAPVCNRCVPCCRARCIVIASLRSNPEKCSLLSHYHSCSRRAGGNKKKRVNTYLVYTLFSIMSYE